MNVFTPIRRHAHAFPDRAALVVDGQEISYGQLLQLTGLAAARLAQHGIGRGNVVALTLRRPGMYVMTALAVARLGGIVMPVVSAWPAEQAAAVLTRHQVHTLVHDFDEDWRHPSLPEGRHLMGRALFTPPPPGTTVTVPPVAQDVGDEPWIIALSSGTTGTPKSIPQTHDRAILTSCLPTTVLPTADLGRVLLFAGPNLSIAMGGILHQLIGGHTAILCSDLNARNFFETVERDRPTHVKTTTGNANGLVAYAAQSLPHSREKCESLQGINVGGSPVSASLRAGIEKYVCPNLEINYGGSEVNRIAQATAETFAAHPGSAGRLRPWVDAQTVDDQGRPLPPGERGVLRVRSPLLVSGYVGDPQTTARAFQGGWFYPGDTGVIDEAGYLTLSGRVDELLNLGGNKVDPFTIEAILDAQPGVEESAAVAVQAKNGSMVLVAVVVASGPIDEAALRDACARRLRPSSVPARIVTAKRLIRNPGGKIMRKEMAAALVAPDGAASPTAG